MVSKGWLVGKSVRKKCNRGVQRVRREGMDKRRVVRKECEKKNVWWQQRIDEK